MTPLPILCFKLGVWEPGVSAHNGPEGMGPLSPHPAPPQLEAQLRHLSSSHQAASSENQQLREAERDLAGQLEEVRGQLQVTQGRLNTARSRVSWQMEEDPRQVAAVPGRRPRPGASWKKKEALSSLRLWSAPGHNLPP